MLVIVAVFTVVAALFLAIVIDLGDQRQNRRQLTTATDAAALAVAQDWEASGADPTFDCGDTTADEDYAVANNPVDNPNPSYNCTFSDVVPFRSGVLTVDSTENVDYSFDGITGVEDGTTGSSTSVLVQPVVGGGIRPVAMCSSDFESVDWTQVSPNIYEAPEGSTVPVTLTNVPGGPDGDPCHAPGNWNAVLFREENTCPGEENPGGGAASVFREQYEEGSDYPVAINDCVSRLPGNGGLSSGEPEAIEGTSVFFPVFDDAPGGGAGIYVVSAFVEAFVQEVVSVGNTTTFVLRPQRLLESGTCCLLNEFNSEREICDVGTLGASSNDNLDERCEARDLSGSSPEPEIPEECGVDDGSFSPAAPATYVNERNQANRPLEASATIVGDDCGAITLVLVREADNTELSFNSPYSPPTIEGEVAADHGIWDDGDFRVEVREDGSSSPLAMASFSLN